MIRLLKIELHKIIYNRTFWILLGLYLLLFVSIAYSVENMFSSFSLGSGGKGISFTSTTRTGPSLYSFPRIWLNVAYFSGMFKILLAIVVIILVTNEYSYKTLRQNIIDGMSKWEIIWAKELVILLLISVSIILLIVTTLVLGNYEDGTSILNGSSAIISYFASLILYLNFAYFLSFWLKKAGFVLGMFILYTLIIENLIAYKLPENVAKFLPMNLTDQLIKNDITSDHFVSNFGMCIVYIGLFISLNYWFLKKGSTAK